MFTIKQKGLANQGRGMGMGVFSPSSMRLSENIEITTKPNAERL